MFKRLLLILLLALAIAAPAASSQNVSPAQPVATQKKDCIVYVTKTGHRYHKAWCSSLSKSKIAMSRSEAIKDGYTPCHRCGGSTCE